MTSLRRSPVRPVLLSILIVIALVLRAQADGPSPSPLSAVSGLQGDCPMLSRAANAHPCPHGSNQSDRNGCTGRAPDPSTSKDLR